MCSSIAVQCDKADGTCDEMTKVYQGYKPHMSREESQKFRFELDVDGSA